MRKKKKAEIFIRSQFVAIRIVGQASGTLIRSSYGCIDERSLHVELYKSRHEAVREKY